MKIYRIAWMLPILFLAAKSGFAKDIYVAQSAAGANSGADCADAHAASWFNSAGSWGTGTTQIGPGTTVHLCGTFTAGLNAGLLFVQGSGTASAPITILFETGAVLQSPAFGSNGAIYNTSNYIVIDGGTNGVIQNTANCTTCANHQYISSGIFNSGSNVEIKNLTIGNIYVRTSTTDHNMAGGPSQNNCIQQSGGSNISIHDNVLHDAGWTIWYGMATGSLAGFSAYNNEVYHMDHGIGFGEGGADGKHFGTINIYNNHFHDPANWDDTASPSGQWYHHDGIHLFAICSGGSWCANTTLTNITIYNNLFDGVWGEVSGGYQVGLTGHIFTEGLLTNLSYFNNISLTSGSSDQYSNNGLVNIGASNLQVFNNTILGAYTGAGECLVLRDEGGTSYAKNNVVASCQVLIDAQSGGMTGGVDYNLYADGGNAAWTWSGTSTTNFSTWQSHGDSHGHFYTGVASLGLSSTGVPQTGSPVIGGATNLTNMGIPALDSDKNGVARPSSGAWDAGAYSSGGTSSGPAAPTNLQGVAN